MTTRARGTRRRCRPRCERASIRSTRAGSGHWSTSAGDTILPARAASIDASVRAMKTMLYTHPRCTLAAASAVALLVLGARDARAADWGTRDYIAAGVPDLGRPWSNADLRKAVDAIIRAAAGHPERLPRYRRASS